MNISLSPELENFIQQKLKSGLYSSSSEVIREALRLMHAHHQARDRQIAQLNQEIEHGLQQLDQGQATDPDLLYKKLKDKYT